MEIQTIEYVLDAVEELEDYIPLLERQDAFNQTIVTHSVAALRQIFKQYKQEVYYGQH
jgi:hypothetical protein